MVLLLQKATLSDIYTTFLNTYTVSLTNGTYYITNDTLGKDNQKVSIFSSAKSFRCPIVLMTFL